MSDQPPVTRINTLRLTNYRRFEDTILEFDPGLTVLVASNGGGKTAVLDALVSVWSLCVAVLSASRPARTLSRSDIRRVVSPQRTMELVIPSRVLASGLLNDTQLEWGEMLGSLDRRARSARMGSARELPLATHLREMVVNHAAGKQAESPTLPLLAYYGTGRLWQAEKAAKKKNAEEADTSRFSGYTDSLSSSSTFHLFESWFKRFSYEAQSEIASATASPHKPRERLLSVRAAVARVLAPSGWQQLEWDFADDTLAASHSECGRLPVRSLSDGIRNMIGLVGDIAHRAVRLNPHFGADACRRTPGVVLIDEVDMHLHPEWQQTVVPSLREAFPAMQLIVTTHSPLVISTVPSRCIRILREDGSVSVPSAETEGYDSPFSLGTVFGVDPRPPGEIGRQLTRYRALVEQGFGDSGEGPSLRESLLEHFGATHPAMLEVDGLRRLQAFKARVRAARGGS